MLGSVLRGASSGAAGGRRPLNILGCCIHERYQSNLARTGHNFYAIMHPVLKKWDARYAARPDNFHLLPEGQWSPPPDVSVDLVLIEQKVGAYQLLFPVAQRLHVPVIVLEHCLPMPQYPRSVLEANKAMRGHVNLFISEYSREKWGWGPDEAEVVYHGVDAEDVFRPNGGGHKERENVLLSVVNQWKERDQPCGYSFWREATDGLPVKVAGDNPGLSVPAPGGALGLAALYRSCSLFVNTSLVSPIPTALLEAMACGCCVVSTRTCMIPEIIEDGQNGFLADTPQEMRQLCKALLKDPAACRTAGHAARKTIEERFSLSRFVRRWQDIFAGAVGSFVPYRRGEFIS